MNDWSVNIAGYTNQNGTADVMTGSDSFAQSVRAYAATQAGHAPEAATTDDVKAFLKKTDAVAVGGDGDGVFEKAEVEAYIKAGSVDVVDYTNRFGTHDVMLGDDAFAMGVRAIAAVSGNEIVDAPTADQVRATYAGADKISALLKEHAQKSGKADDFATFTINADVFEKDDMVFYAQIIKDNVVDGARKFASIGISQGFKGVLNDDDRAKKVSENAAVLTSALVDIKNFYDAVVEASASTNNNLGAGDDMSAHIAKARDAYKLLHEVVGAARH